MKKTIGNYELTECQAIAFEASETTKQQAIFIHNITDEFGDGDGVLFCHNIEYIETEDELIDIFENEPNAFTTDSETLESVELTKYEIIKNETTAKKKSEIHEGITLKRDDMWPEIVECYYNEGEALEALKKYESDVYETSSMIEKFYEITEYYVQENVYSIDGEWIRGGDVSGFSKMEGDF